MASCTSVNPFFETWDTPYGIPPYDQIKVSDYLPALKEGMKQQNAKIDEILSCCEAPTFDNTVVPLENSDDLLSKVVGVLFNVSETDRSDALDAVVEKALPLLSAHADAISFNKQLYARVASVMEREYEYLNREQQMVLKKLCEGFVREGVNLPEDIQAELKDINAQMALLTQKIGNNILAESNAFKEEFGFSVSAYPDEMTTTQDRELRRRYNEFYTSRGHRGNENDNTRLILEVMRLRIRRAQLLGYATPAAYELADKMAGTPETVDAFLAPIMEAALRSAGRELKDMQAVMDADIQAGLLPEGSTIQPWDWWYYAEKVRKARYDLDEEQTKPYFQIDSVVKGMFLAANKLYGVKAVELSGVPVYNPEVTTYKIIDSDGSLAGIFTTDYFPRASKRGGAWMNNVRDQYVTPDGEDVRPIIVNVGNLHENLSVDEVQTVFHEFGHALHGLLTRCHYASVSGTSVKRDYVEMLSQFNENWAFQPELLAAYARNVEGEVIPAELVARINNALKFNQGFMTTELCAASILDMKWHSLTEIPDEAFSDPAAWIDAFEKKVCDEMGLIPEIAPRYRTTYFNHIFSSGYSAGYYGYLWAEVLDKDAFSFFTARPDVFDKELATRFKETFLQKGGAEEPMVLYESFAGRKPDQGAFLRARGLE